ncbi:MAG TPA: helicase-associated domain-containing protein, partial [Ktedonobacterales bacterium]|nr:helicase-associated domain-containing protein [Ktedonobacterales bacterium]
LLARLPRVLPLTPLPDEPLPSASGLHEQRAEAGLPALLLLVAAQMVDRGMPATGATASQKPASRSTLDLDAALAQQWAALLKTTPEQARFCLALLRLLGIFPAMRTPRAPSPEQAAALDRPAISSEQARENLLRAYHLLLARPQAEVARDLFTHWLHAASARELVELRDAGVRVAWLSQRETRHAPDIAAENQMARQFIVDLLRSVPAGRWWSFGSLVEFVWRFQPAFLRGRQQTFLRPQWWLERLPEGQPLSVDVRADWRQAEGRYIALLMRRALHWLGVVDLALDEKERLKGFRVTPSGALLLGAVAMSSDAPVSADDVFAPASATPGELEIQDDGTLLAPPGALRSDQLETLLWWCEPAGAAAGALRFRLSAERVAAALDAGQDLEAWLAWLEQHPQSAALTALVAQVRQWAALYGQVRVYESATMLEVSDQAVLQELEVTLALSERYVDHALAPGLAVLRPAAVEALIDEMQRRGYAPWITDDEASN